jgi:hypothetical protein
MGFRFSQASMKCLWQISERCLPMCASGFFDPMEMLFRFVELVWKAPKKFFHGVTTWDALIILNRD